jgi:hypothetical protein
MAGMTIWVKLKGRPVQMVVTESRVVWEPERKGFALILQRPKGIIAYEGFLPMGADKIEENVRESANQMPGLDRSIRGYFK